MKTHFHSTFNAFLLVIVAGAAGLLGRVSADEVFSSDFSKGSLDQLGWKSKGSHWTVEDLISQKPDMKNDPGACAFYGKTDEEDLLIKTFPTVTNPSTLTLTFDAGWAWGSKDQGADSFSVELLNDVGSGYIFSVHRTKAKWAAQWGLVDHFVASKKLHWSDLEIDATQDPVTGGGGLQTFTIKLDDKKAWTISGANWQGVNFQFVDPDQTTGAFSQVVLVGSKNFDGLVFNKVRLETTADAQ